MNYHFANLLVAWLYTFGLSYVCVFFIAVTLRCAIIENIGYYLFSNICFYSHEALLNCFHVVFFQLRLNVSYPSIVEVF